MSLVQCLNLALSSNAALDKTLVYTVKAHSTSNALKPSLHMDAGSKKNPLPADSTPSVESTKRPRYAM